MTRTIQDASPVRPASSSEDSPEMSRHSLVDPCPPAWPEALSSSGSFLPIGSVVPISVLNFADDGTATDVVPQSTADRLADEIRAELDAMGVTYVPQEWESTSGACALRWPVLYGQYFCTASVGHCRDHKAHDTEGTVVATHPADATVAAKPVRRRPSPQPRTTVA